jgi:CRP-like cAMP-binding protein
MSATAETDTTHSLDPTHLQHFVPLCELQGESLQELLRHINVATLPAGEVLFHRGDNDNQTFYLLEGEVNLSDGGQTNTLRAASAQSRFPMDHHTPRQYTATAKSAIRYLRIENNLLDILLTWDQNASYVVKDIDEQPDTEENDWMTSILQSRLFHKVPAANIQAMFMRMEAVPARKGELILKQGQSGDYYYVIKSGNCAVYRKSAETGDKSTKIAELGPGQSFGEESLISDSPRNASVIMVSDGVLMRLAKEDFASLLKAPVLKSVDYQQALDMGKQGAVWLDVRLLSEHQHRKIPGSINIPLYLLRLNADKLSFDRTYLVYCDTGRRSASAAYILNERGYNAYVLNEGLMALPQASNAA